MSERSEFPRRVEPREAQGTDAAPPHRHASRREAVLVTFAASKVTRTRSVWKLCFKHGTRYLRKASLTRVFRVFRLVNTLQQHYGIGDRDVYAHDVISNKTAGEGAGLYTPAAEPEPERLQQPSSPRR